MYSFDEFVAAIVRAPRSMYRTMLMVRYQTFSDACMVSCALVSMSDNKLDSAERAAVVGFIKNLRELQPFSAPRLFGYFMECCRQSNFEMERIELLKVVRRLRYNKRQARLVVKIATRVLAAENVPLTEAEKVALGEIIFELGLAPLAFADRNLRETAGE